MDKETRPLDKRQKPDSEQTDQAPPRGRTISGPGASDFIAAPGGEDLPGFGPGKGMSETRGDSDFVDPKKVVPRLAPDVEPPQHEHTHFVPDAQEIEGKTPKKD